MFRAIGKYVRALFYLITFRIDKATETLRSNPGVVSSNYDRIIREKRDRINQYKDAVGAMIAQEESKKAKLKAVTDDIERLQRLKAGAAAKARQVAQRHGGDPQATKADPEYAKCQAAFRDFSSTLVEKEQRADELTADLEQLIKSVESHKVQVEALLRDLGQLKEEKHDAVADVISAREERQVADLMTGLSEDRTSEELRELRELRQKSKASARMSRELAGLDAKRAENEFLEFAQDSQASDEFDTLIGLSESDAGSTADPSPETRIPES